MEVKVMEAFWPVSSHSFSAKQAKQKLQKQTVLQLAMSHDYSILISILQGHKSSKFY